MTFNFRFLNLVCGLTLLFGVTPTTHSHAIEDKIHRGGSTAGDRLNLLSTSHTTKGGIDFGTSGKTYYDETTDIFFLNGIQFDLTPTGTTAAEGKMVWNTDDGTINVGMPGGDVNGQMFQEMYVPKRPRNVSGGTMPNGTVVYLSGETGAVPEISLADASTEVLSSETIGLTTQDIDDNQRGYVTTIGLVRGSTAQPIDTSGFASGAPLWLSEVAGEFTDTKPASPAHSVGIGKVNRVHATEGEILLSVDNGFEVYELHDVDDGLISPTAGELIAWNSATTLWEQTSGLTYSFTDGAVAHQNTADSATGFQVNDADGGFPVFNIDTAAEMVGVRTAAPLVDFHVKMDGASSGGTFGASVGIGMERDDSCNMLISVPNTKNTSYAFGDDNDPFRAALQYLHATDTMRWFSNNAARGDIPPSGVFYWYGAIGANMEVPGAQLGVEATGSTVIGAKIKLAAAHSVDALQVLTSADAELFVVDKDGAFVANEQGADADTRIEGSGEANLVYVDAGAVSVGIKTATPDATLQVVGDTKFGDDNTNYFTTDSSGRMTLVGDARVERFVESMTITGRGASAPTERTTEAPYLSWTFSIGSDSHQSFEAPYQMDYTGVVAVKVHWYTSVDQTGDEVRFEAMWNAIPEAGGEAINAGATTVTSADVNCPTQWHITETSIGTIAASSIAQDDIIGLDLERIAIVDGTDPAINTIHILSIEFEYYMNRLGEPI